jgi:hypothetical protein
MTRREFITVVCEVLTERREKGSDSRFFEFFRPAWGYRSVAA